MCRRRARRLHRHLRIMLMLVIALCVVAQPALSKAGEVHDAFVHPGEALAHHEAGDAHDGTADGGADPVHFFMHHAHCCAASTAMPVMLPSLPDVAGMPGTSMPAPRAGHAQTRPGHPFRPPIAA